MKTYREFLESQAQKLAPLQARYEALQARERRFVAVAGMAVAATLVYLLLWHPLAAARGSAETSLAAEHNLAQRIETIGAATRGAQSGAVGALVSPDASLLSAVDLATKNGMIAKPPSRMTPDGDNQVRVTFDDVSFDAVLRWMNELQTRYGVRIDSVDIERQPTPGNVNVRLSLVRAS